MFLKHRSDGSLVEVLSTAPLFDPFESRIPGRFHAGEEVQEPESFAKADLAFPSGEALPGCWINPDYGQSQGGCKTNSSSHRATGDRPEREHGHAKEAQFESQTSSHRP